MITHIIDDIYIGDWADAERYQYEYETFTVAKECEFKGKHFYPLVDKADESNEFLLSRAISGLILERQGTRHKILVHCVYGKSRSVAVVLGYMIFFKNFSFDNALRHMKICKSEDGDLVLNPYFKKLLWDIEKSGNLYKNNRTPIEGQAKKISKNSERKYHPINPVTGKPDPKPPWEF
jgi:protein-tyrosine phosphatase